MADDGGETTCLFYLSACIVHPLNPLNPRLNLSESRAGFEISRA